MTKIALAAAFCCLTAALPAPVFAADACASVLCLYGKMTGNSGGSDCTAPEKDYFDIVAHKKHHHFDPTKTARDRLNFLKSCPGADPAQVKAINSMFGKWH